MLPLSQRLPNEMQVQITFYFKDVLQWHEDHYGQVGVSAKLNADCMIHAALEDDKVSTTKIILEKCFIKLPNIWADDKSTILGPTITCKHRECVGPRNKSSF